MLAEQGYLFGFFQLVELLRRWQGGPPVGGTGPYREERIHFRPNPALSFSPSDVRLSEPGDDGRWQVAVNFMGLYGVAAPTPVYLSELIGFTDVDAEPLTDFLDLFNHRLISLFFRAWLKHRFPNRYEPGGTDEVSSYVLSFVGLGEPKVHPLTRLPVFRLMKYLGLMSPHTKPPVCLRLMISDYFGDVPVEVREFMTRWVKIPPSQRSRLGAASSSLGMDLTIGERVPDRAGKFRVVIGPLHYDTYLELLPGTRRFADLCSLGRLWVFDELAWDVELKIRRDEVPSMVMDPDNPPQLGWTSWVKSPEADLNDDPRIVFETM
jgi:type VI secretion system protein ImpH